MSFYYFKSDSAYRIFQEVVGLKIYNECQAIGPNYPLLVGKLVQIIKVNEG